MKKINKIGIGVTFCALFLGLAVFGVNVKIETKPEFASATTTGSEYKMTGGTWMVNVSNASTASAPVNCSNNIPSGFTLEKRTCLQSNGATCYADMCLWKKTNPTDNFEYTLTSGVTSRNDSGCLTTVPVTNDVPGERMCTSVATLAHSYCGYKNPGAGFTLKSAVWVSQTAGGNGLASVCLWQRPSTSTTVLDYSIIHAGSTGTPVNSGNSVPSGYSLTKRVCATFNTYCYSDMSLVQKTSIVSTTQCSDNIDNDNDGATDYPNDFSCSSATDNDETNPRSQCQDGLDNDNDNLTDYPQDPGCSSKQDNNESNAAITCSSNANCGTDGLIGASSCGSNGNPYRVNRVWTCNNAGTTSSSCSYADTNQQQTTCNYNQTCFSGNCVNNTITACTSHNSYRCSGNGVYWFNSCGVQEELYQACNGDQTCPAGGNVCVNQNTSTSLSVLVTVRNLSAGNLNWSNSVSASPSDIVQFNITVQATGNSIANNITVRDTLPSNLYYNNFLTVDGVSNSGNITNGVNIGNLSYGQTKTITYQAQVAPSQNFGFGTTTLTDAVNATSTNTYNTSGTGSASVVVVRSGILGATTVSTGLTNNPWVDSFFLPLILALLGVWVWKSGLLNSFGFAGFVNAKKASTRDFTASKELQSKISEIREKESL